MAARADKPSFELEVPECGLQVNIFNTDEGEVDVWLDMPKDPKNGIVIGTGLATRTALRDALSSLREAITAIENHLEDTK